MGHVRPISDDKWDSWEPLVAGLPLFLRLILFQDALVVLFLPLLLVGCFIRREPPESAASMEMAAVVLKSCGWLLYCLLVLSWLEAYKAKRWALLSLGLMSMAASIGFAVLAFLSSNDVHAVVFLPVAALAAVEGAYLLRLRAKLVRLGLP
jgi:hypothetical protein